MFCNEKITNVFLGKNKYHDIEGADCWFDCYHDIAFHTTDGYRYVLETENNMISLGADGVSIQSKKEFTPKNDEWLEETIHVFEDKTEDGTEIETIVEFINTLFVGQRLHSVEKNEKCFILEFDDFKLKLIPYDLGEYIPSLRKDDDWSYNNVLGFDRFIKAKCPLCGGEGEILLDFVKDFVVRCKSCKKSTYAEIQLRHAIDHWNDGEVRCDLSDITIE